MKLDIAGLTIFDFDFSFGEGAGIVIFGIVVFLTLLAAPLWKWW